MKTLLSFFLLTMVLTGCFSKRLTMTPTEEIKKGKETTVNSRLLEGILKQHPQFFDSLLHRTDTWQIKIIYTQIDRRANNHPVFKNYYFNIDPDQYFYP